MWLQVRWEGQAWSPSNSWSLSHCFQLMSSTEEEEWRNDSCPVLTISKTPNHHWTTHRSQTTQKYSDPKTSHQTRPYQRDQRDFGLKAQMVVKLLRATDSSTHSHFSGSTLLLISFATFFWKKNFSSIVNFPNSACTGNSGVEGTCYTSSQCSSRVNRWLLWRIWTMLKPRAAPPTAPVPQGLEHVAPFWRPVTRRPQKMEPIFQGDQVSLEYQVFFSISWYGTHDNPSLVF